MVSIFKNGLVVRNLRVRPFLSGMRPIHIIHKPHIEQLVFDLLHLSLLLEQLQFQVLPVTRLIYPLIHQVRLYYVHGL